MQAELIDTGNLARSIEAVLFVASEALSIKALAKLTGAQESDVSTALAQIDADFAERGIVLREIAGGYRLASAPAARAAVEAYLRPPKTNLSPAALETLAIVAYMQPVTKGDIEGIRGVSADSVLSTLVDRRFLAEAGRKEVAGRPILYRTTSEFLEAFGLRSLEELPPIDVDAATPLELALPIETQAVRYLEDENGAAESNENDAAESNDNGAAESNDNGAATSNDNGAAESGSAAASGEEGTHAPAPSDWSDAVGFEIAEEPTAAAKRSVSGHESANAVDERVRSLDETESIVGGTQTIIGERENVVGESENVVGASENVVGASENVIGENENVVGESETVIGENENVIGENENVVGKSENVVGESVNVIGENENVVGESENFVGESDNVIGESENVVGESENVVGESENVVDESENVLVP